MGLGVPGQLKEDVVRPSDTPVIPPQFIKLAALPGLTSDSPSSFILELLFQLTLAAEGELTARSYRYMQPREHFTTMEVEDHGIDAGPLLDG